MTALALRQEGPTELIPVQSETGAIVSMIERAARDPAVDVDKLRQLIAMRDEAEAKASERAFNAAMTQAQQEMRVVGKNAANSQTHSRYVTYDKLDQAIRPIYTKHSFGVSFDTDVSPKGNDYVRVLAFVTHGGHQRTYKLDVPVVTVGPQGKAVMTAVHATQSAFTYGKRGLLSGIFNIAVGENDDDGNAASDTGELLSAEQAEEMRALIVDTGANLQAFLKWAKVEKIDDIRADYFESCMNAIRKAGK